MQFIVTGYDGTDSGAMERRLTVREEHLKLADSMREEGKLLFAIALLDDNEKMIGSKLIMEFPTRDELDKWLEKEPYVKGNVWQQVEVNPCKVPPMFLK
ncbi:MAG: hypothetical protein FH761_14840 [Firmicutes bacterium]|nr:hypothetical protein [Bacillota bacterium]